MQGHVIMQKCIGIQSSPIHNTHFNSIQLHLPWEAGTRLITDLGIRQRVCNPAPSLTSFVCFVVALPLIVLSKQRASRVMFIDRQTDGHSLGHNGKEITMIKKTVGCMTIGNLLNTFYMTFFILISYRDLTSLLSTWWMIKGDPSI